MTNKTHVMGVLERLESAILAANEKNAIVVTIGISDAKHIAAQLAPIPPTASSDRCPHCSFDPTNSNDFCDEHRPKIFKYMPVLRRPFAVD